MFSIYHDPNSKYSIPNNKIYEQIVNISPENKQPFTTKCPKKRQENLHTM